MRKLGLHGRRFETRQKVEQELKLPVLGEIPLPTVGAEALTRVYSQVYSEVARQIGQNNGQHRTLAVTSALPGEGRSCVAANLAVAAAHRGWSVLAIDTDVRSPLLPELLGATQASSSAGLIDLLSQKAQSPSEVLRSTPLDNIRLLTSGNTQGVDVQGLFSSVRLERFVRLVAPRLADFVVFDAPHILSKEPGRPILGHADGVLFVVRLGETDGTRARHALEILAEHQVNVTGIICLEAGIYPPSQAVPLPISRRNSSTFSTNLKKSRKDTETLGNTTSSAEELPPTDAASLQGEYSDGTSMKVFGAQKIEENREPDPSKGKAGVGIEDLEAVLQGWRRRDTTNVEVVEEVPAPAVSLSTAPDTEVVTTSTPPVGVAFPMAGLDSQEKVLEEPVQSGSFLSIATGANQESSADVAEPKPILTIVEAEEAESKEPVSMKTEETTFEPVAPVIPVASSSDPEPEANPIISGIPNFAVPVMPIMSAPEPVVPVMPIAGIPIPVAPEPAPAPVVAAAAPEVVAPAPTWSAPPPPPAPVAAPVIAAPVIAPPTVAPVQAWSTPPAPIAHPVAPPPAPAVSTAPVASVATAQRSGLDLQVDMFQTSPGEMTMRAAATNAAAVGYPNISLEIAVAMNTMRGMRVITPSSTGGADQPRITLESVVTDAPEAARLRLVVGNAHEPALDVVLKSGEAFSLRTGTGPEQPMVRIDSHNQADGATILRATLVPARGGQELILELRREPVNDGFTDARWRNRVSFLS